ncbi:MAG: hypothetical protein HFG28_11880 [Eubacterium sp.]|nr:hypothetical protein [Eubacterium sp.]
MKKYYVSDYWNKGRKGHLYYEFIDVAVNDDNLLFIDPLLIEIAGDEWCQEAKATIKSFFDGFYNAYKEKDLVQKRELLSHAGEQNGTRLGYGRGDNGKGNTVNGLLEIFTPLEQLLPEISTIKKVEDLSLLIPDFAEDGLSDLLTNILHELLNEFTLQQMKKYGIESNGFISFWAWDRKDSCWKKIEKPSYYIYGQELLVIPKHIVRKKYLFSTSQYFNRIILERIREEGGYMDGDKPIPKKEIVKAKRFSGEHWQYDESISYTKKNNDALDEYHKKLPHYYAENGYSMEDKELDELIYGYFIEQTA